jgi:hypothetical protein
VASGRRKRRYPYRSSGTKASSRPRVGSAGRVTAVPGVSESCHRLEDAGRVHRHRPGTPAQPGRYCMHRRAKSAKVV